MTFHFPDEVDTNQLTIDATDPKSGTAEFKAAAIRVEKLEPAEREQRAGVAEPAAAGGSTRTSAHRAVSETVLSAWPAMRRRPCTHSK